ncbi:MAG: stage V sporulation protein AD [Clostridia bacterium]|nr:stage V sporulation protein AD [Clostridia bacterium]
MRNCIKPKIGISIESSSSVVGKKEHEGPLSGSFDIHDSSDRFGMKTWEEAESQMQHLSLNTALSKAKLRPCDVDVLFAGDLQNQCVGSTFGIKHYEIPYFGLFGACSTFAEGVVLASLLIDAGYAKRAAVTASSHFCSAERQFRMPLEYGGQRPPTAQHTVTGAGSFVLTKGGEGPYISGLMAGIINDMGITDASNMGAAMAPAAFDTLQRYFTDTGRAPRDYDLILTGDLGEEGHSLLLEYSRRAGYDLSSNYNDCGLLIYSDKAADTHCGGSGCGCSAVVMSGYIMSRLRKKEINRVLYLATGALMSPTSSQQGKSIPAIAHLVEISNI